MVKNNVQLKDGLSIVDRINMTRYITEGYFIDGEYTPYYADINKAIAFFRYCIDGLEFDEDDDIYGLCTSDPKLVELYMIGLKDGSPIYADISKVLSDVDDMVDFYKKKLLISSSPIISKLEEILDKESRNKDEELALAKQMEKTLEANQRQIDSNNRIAEVMGEDNLAKLLNGFANSNLSLDEMAQSIVNAYGDSVLHKDNVDGLIEEKNNKIVELESLLNKK